MNFFMRMIPPTTTAQEKQVKVVHGKPIFYEPPRVTDARRMLTGHLYQHKPDNPLTGPISLTAIWLFPKGTKHKHGEWRTTKPDTDNLQKMLKDCMTAVGFWKDDAQVARETIEKIWSDDPTGIWIEIEKLNE